MKKKDQIGTNAGIIWRRLEADLTDTKVPRLIKECRIKKDDFYMALGWLAREDKIKLIEIDESMYVFPVNT